VTIKDFFTNNDFEKSLIIGYYGGGNYGDELLLEVIGIMLHSRGQKSITIGSVNPSNYSTYHKDYGFKVIDIKSLPQLIGAVLRNKKIIIGGGGHWGVDFNPSILILSAVLYFSKVVLRRKVYLVGVGYYSSTSQLGHFAARLAAKASTHIIGRDNETNDNFKRYTDKVSLDKDIAWQMESMPLTSYEAETKSLAREIGVQQNSKLGILTLRRFKPGLAENYLRLVEQAVINNSERSLAIFMMEPKSVDPEGFARAVEWKKQNPNLRVVDFTYNPVCLFLLFKNYPTQLAVIAPQFHVILTAMMTEVPYLAFAYDNKVSELLKQHNIGPITINDLTAKDISIFLDNELRQS
jgi:polysaccharide pyruvyl transferase WcaK-like protein